MRRRFWIAVAFAFSLRAQPVVAPTQAQVGTARGENTGDYNVTNSFELGYRWVQVGGDVGMYRSVVNFRNGVRLLGSSLTVNSKDGHGRYFDEILLTTQGLGADPYENVMLRVQKNGLYRYDMNWRLNDYFNPGLTIAGGLHLRDTSRRIQDHELTLFPQSHYRLRVGYSRNKEDGPALSTAQEFDLNGAGLPVFADVRRLWNEYRLGADLELQGFRFSFTRRWDFFKDDTPYGPPVPLPPPTGTDQTVLSQFARSEPIHGSNPGWLGNLFTRRKLWGVNARATYTNGSRDFALDEVAFGTGQFGGAASRQIFVGGNASRPDFAGDFAINLFPTENLTIINYTSGVSNRVDGLSSYSEVQNGTDLGQTIFFRFLGVRLITNSTDANYRITNRIGVYGGYHYSDRLVRTIDGFTLPAFANSSDQASYHVSNHLNSGVLGLRFRLWKPVTVKVDGEIGRANFPLTPISDRNYHAINGRVEYRTRHFQALAFYNQKYNLNAPFTFATFNSHSRQYSVSASWAPHDWMSIDASYTKLHLDTRGGIAFFASTGIRPTLQSAFPSFFTSNAHIGTLGARFVIRRRADLFLGYAINKDTGDGRATQVPPDVTNPVQVLLDSVQTFPLTYQSPLGRVSIKISPKVRWNAGFQYYGYNEQFHIFGYNQNFHAPTGFTSMMWSF
jgi:hypothetical protein